MNRAYPSYSISLEQNGLQTRQIQHHDNLNHTIPTLQNVLNWIDAQATEVRKIANEMRKTSAVKITLHARLPMETDPSGLCKQKGFSVEANGDEINELKRRVTDAYEKN